MTAIATTVDALELARVVHAGDRIAWGQACAEPVGLLRALAEQAADIGDLSGFCGLTFSPELVADVARQVALTSYGVLGGLRDVAAAGGGVRVVRCHLSALPELLTAGPLRCDVAFVQVAPADQHGRHSMGVAAEYVHDVACAARVVVAEVNEQLPRTMGASLPADRIDVAVHTSRAPLGAPVAVPQATDRAIAEHVAALVDDGDCIQLGVGVLPDAVASALHGHRRLGVHSGMVSDTLVDLVEHGVVTGAGKQRDRGLVVTGAALGSERLFRFLDGNDAVRVRPTSYTHDARVLRDLGPFVSINGALEVDLTGQVGAELAGERQIGAVGGQVDFGRGAVAAGGRAVIVLASRDRAGRPAIVQSLAGPVTTARSDVDIVVTEHGSASLRGLDVDARAAALTRIAHPDDRDDLARRWSERRVP